MAPHGVIGKSMSGFQDGWKKHPVPISPTYTLSPIFLTYTLPIFQPLLESKTQI